MGALVLTAVLWALAAWHFQRSYVEELRSEDVPDALRTASPGVPESLLARVGAFQTTKRSSAMRFERTKPKGVHRVCSFGDSFTYGHEVGDTSDYPSILQEYLDQGSGPPTQVLNFGQSNFGFHQAYLVWDGLGRDFGCDTVLIGPATFFPARDTSFGHDVTSPYYLHARYVLDGDDVQLMEVAGDTVDQRFEEYHRLLPRLRYLFYDRRPPAVIRAFLGRGRTMDNPFYYRSDSPREEALETYRILLERLAADVADVIVASRSDFASDLEHRPGANVTFFDPAWPRSFPYRAPDGHFGPMGNDLLAQQFANRLRGRAQEPLWVIRSMPLTERRAAGGPVNVPAPVGSFSEIHVEMLGVPLGHFAVEKAAPRRVGSSRILRKNKVDSLVAVGELAHPAAETQSASILDQCLLPLDQNLLDGAPVWLVVGGDRQQIGEVRLLDHRIALGQVAFRPKEMARAWQIQQLRGRGRFQLKGPMAEGASGKVSVRVNDEEILVGRAGRMPLGLSPPPGKGCYVARANGTGRVSMKELPDTGVFELLLRRRSGRRLRVPVARWEKVALGVEGAAPSAD